MPRKLSAKTVAARRFKRTGTAAGRAQDKRLKAKTVPLKDYVPQQNDYRGVDTPKRRITKKAPAKRKPSGNERWKKMAAAALRKASIEYHKGK